MKEKPFLSAFLVLILVLTLLLPLSSVNAADNDTIKIMFTHDMHCSIVPAVVSQDGAFTESGGFARLYTAVQRERSAATGSTLLVDAGDYSMGTLFQTLETTESPELRLMGSMGYDAVTAGNHEFDYTGAGFAASLKAAADSREMLPAYVMSNITLPEGNAAADKIRQAMNDYGVKDYTVVEKDGVRIGIYGLMGEEADADAPMAVPAEFGDKIEVSKRVVKVLKEQENADLIVCLSHSGTWKDKGKSEDELLAKAVPGIDVIISGHTHTVLTEPIIVGKTIIVSCGANSAFLGVLDIKNDNGWSVDSYKLVNIDSSIQDDESIASAIDGFKARVDEYLKPYGYGYDEIIAHSPYQFEDGGYMQDNPGNHALGDILADAFVYAVRQAEGDNYEPVDLAVVPMGTIRATINKGDLTVADAFKVLSLGTGPDGLSGYPLISVYLKGSELINVCEVDASISSIMGDAQLFFSGLRYTYDPGRLIFNKVTGAELVREDGTVQAIEPDKLYRVVCGIYSGQMLSYVQSKSFGIVSLVPKDKDCAAITDFTKQIIYADEDGEKREIKEWQAVTGYLSSFDKQSGVSAIPAEYSEAQSRKVEARGSIFSLFSSLNTFAIIVYSIIFVLLILIAFIIYKTVRRIIRGPKRAPAAKTQ